MRQSTLLIIFHLFSSLVFCQTLPSLQDTLPPYLKSGRIPDFEIRVLPDSAVFSEKDIQQDKSTVIMIFSPECNHCADVIQQLKKGIGLLKDVRFVCITPLKYHQILQFSKDMGLEGMTQFVLGRDPEFKLGSFYQLKTLPTLFLYNTKGEFIRKFEGEDISPQKIAAALQNY